MKSFRGLLFSATFLLLGCPFAFAYDSSPGQIGLGLNYGGLQLDYRGSKWMFEVRAQKGSDRQTAETTSTIVGLRTYRFLKTAKSPHPYWGLETAAVSAKQDATGFNASGISLGGFVGLSFPLGRHMMMGFDVGPYFVTMTEKTTHANEGQLNFVGDTFLAVFL